MPVEYTEEQAALGEIVSVEDGEALFAWLQGRHAAKVDASACVHLHPAALQLLMATAVHIVAWPDDVNLRAWLETALLSN